MLIHAWKFQKPMAMQNNHRVVYCALRKNIVTQMNGRTKDKQDDFKPINSSKRFSMRFLLKQVCCVRNFVLTLNMQIFIENRFALSTLLLV